MPPPINPLLIAIPILVALIAMAVYGWSREKKEEPVNKDQRQAASHRDQRQEADHAARQRQEEERRAGLAAQAAILRLAGEQWQRQTGAGQLPIVAIGTAAANQLPLIAEGFVRASAASFLAPILLAEPDAAIRTTCRRDLPQGIPPVIDLDLPLLPAGLKGATVDEGQRLERYWMPELQQTTDTWLSQVRLRAKPAALWMLVSPGGSAALGRPIIERFKAEYDQADVYVILVLDHKTDRREINIPALLDLYSQDDLVRGFIILENRRSSQLFDQALAQLLPSLIVAPWIDHRPQSGFNVLPDVFRRQRVATLRTWVGWLPVRYEPAWQGILPAFYRTDLSFCQAQAIRGIAEVATNADLQSLPLPSAGQPHFIYVSSNIRPKPDLHTLAERVGRSPIPGLGFDTTVGFASIGYPMEPATQQAPITVVSLLPVLGGIEAVKRYVLQEKVRTIFDEPQQEASSASSPWRNGLWR